MTEPARQALAEAVGSTNPFRMNRVSRPDEVRSDVTAIHGAEFRKLLARVEEARQGASCGVLLTGIAGCGKSHLIARLHRQALASGTVAPVFLHNLQASPERMARYVLKATISHLSSLRQPGGVLEGLRAALDDRPARGADPLDTDIHATFKSWLAMSDNPEDEDLVEAAVGWLSGEELDEDQTAFVTALTGRSIRPMLPDDAAIERVLILLAGLLAKSGRVLVLCLDQIDNLDREQVGGLTAFLHALIDHADHLLVICSGVTTTMAELQRTAISEAGWDRIAQYRVELQEVNPDQARMLVSSRLDDFLAPFGPIHRSDDPLFPLGQAWFTERFQAPHFPPRHVITWARDGWEDVQAELDRIGVDAWLTSRAAGSAATAAPAPDRPVELAIRDVVSLKVEEHQAERLVNPSTLPPDTDNLGTLLRVLLKACAGWPGYSLISAEPPEKPRRGVAPSFDLLIRENVAGGGQAVTGLVSLPGGHGNATTAALRRILADQRPLEHILVVSDDRRPFKLTKGSMGQEYYRQLAEDPKRRFDHVRLDGREVAQLDALVSVLGLARVGDLEVEHPRGTVRPVTEAEALEALHGLDLFRAHPLLRQLLMEEEAPTETTAGPLDDRAVRNLIAGHLAWRVGATVGEVARKIAHDRGLGPVDEVVVQVSRVAAEMHREGSVQVGAVDAGEDAFLLWTGGAV